MNALTQRQSCFVDEYVLCGNAAEAARRAGYSERTAHQIAYENLRKPEVTMAISAARQQIAVDFELRKEDVVIALFKAFKLAEAQADPATMVSAAREMGRLMGFYEKQVATAAGGASGEDVRRRFATMSDEELMALVTGEGQLCC